MAGDSLPRPEQLTHRPWDAAALLGGCAKGAQAWEGGPHPAHGWVQVVCCGSGLTALSLTLPGANRASGAPPEGSARCQSWCLRPSLRRRALVVNTLAPGAHILELCLEAVLGSGSRVKGLEGEGSLHQSLPMSQARPSTGSGPASAQGGACSTHPHFAQDEAAPWTPTLSLYLLGLDLCRADPEGPRPCFSGHAW